MRGMRHFLAALLTAALLLSLAACGITNSAGQLRLRSEEHTSELQSHA